MDLNDIYERYSISLELADRTDDARVEADHRALADRYSLLIEQAKVHGTPALAS